MAAMFAAAACITQPVPGENLDDAPGAGQVHRDDSPAESRRVTAEDLIGAGYSWHELTAGDPHFRGEFRSKGWWPTFVVEKRHLIGPHLPPPHDPTSDPRKLVYLCDASGTMAEKMHMLKSELHKAIGALWPHQMFNVVFLTDSPEVRALRHDRLLVATTKNKSEAVRFIDETVVSEHADPLAALRLAFAQNPDRIYLLTDKAFDDPDAIVQEIRRLNAEKRVSIFTIAFLEPGPAYHEILRIIAQENRGEFRFVTMEHLQEIPGGDGDQ